MNISEEIKKIAEHYGYEEQSRLLMEECSELIQAVNKFHRAMKRNTADKRRLAVDNYLEEIADVEVMIEQVKYLLQIPEEEILAMKIYKINRTKEDIAKELATKNKGE